MTNVSIRNEGVRIARDAFEIALLSSPVWISSTVLATLGTVESPVLLWSGIGVVGLIIAIGFSRRSSVERTLIAWPVPETPADWATSVIAYNTTLLLGTVIADVAWLAVDSWPLGSILAVVAPVWFLHHVYFFIYKI